MQRSLALSLALAAVAAPVACKRAAQNSFNERFVIAPGQQALMDEIIGRGATLPGGCAVGDTQVGETYFQARYQCPGRGGPAVIEFRHREVAPQGAVTTARFALIPYGREGVPGPLLEAVTARAREREAAWRWAPRAGGRVLSRPLGTEGRAEPGARPTAPATDGGAATPDVHVVTDASGDVATGG